MEVYIDDIVVKSKTRSEHAQHLEETFHLMKMYKMKLNPTKCAFGFNASKFMGFMVTQRWIEVNLDQIKAVIETSAPSSKKELQSLMGRLAILECFVTHFINKLRLFFLTLKGVGVNRWTNDCEQALR